METASRSTDRDLEPGGDNAFEVRWDEHDTENPHRLTARRKWAIELLICSTTLCITVTSSLYVSTLHQTMTELHCSRIVATLGLSLFIGGLGWGPLVLSPVSEFYGRRPIYRISLPLFVLFLVPCAVARNIETLLVARLLTGLAGAAFTSVAGATVGDMYTKDQLHFPMLVYTASPFTGSSFGPMVGGLINSFASWRWSFYTLLIWSSIQCLLVLCFVPETYHPVLLRRKARRLRKETGEERWQAPIERLDRSILMTVIRSLYRPFMLLLLEPMCLNLCILSAIALGIQYLFFGSFKVIFGTVNGWGLWQSGLAFAGITAGMIAAVAVDPWCRRLYTRMIPSTIDATDPERRLPPAVIGAPLLTIGLFWFAWTAVPSVHWSVPIIGSSLFGAGMILVYAGVFTFLVDAYSVYAASALGANSFTRSTFAAAFPLFGYPMYRTLGNPWATSLLAFLSLVMAPFPYVFFRYGKKIRRKSRFATRK
ncbi:MFS transporter [Aspergillus saccharolyticus JOP 1030-1]|uniref:MFS general substrate transporter n=1 Tax=Aspergillus saccharolyticus JOP 1030-1 TaxID=1450539 RepID=A0A318Z145_9EURO|nr:MFS general substrate transporter [Aspergillus saccharolyticus JOP 1030-1]PYH40716.1 MFS general substrate transporter [Aspergillus saccharolyticus JOP 1030-1]